MMNMDMARAGGEGIVSNAKKKTTPEMEDPTNVLTSGPQIFQSDEKELSIKVPEGWHAKRME